MTIYIVLYKRTLLFYSVFINSLLFLIMYLFVLYKRKCGFSQGLLVLCHNLKTQTLRNQLGWIIDPGRGKDCTKGIYKLQRKNHQIQEKNNQIQTVPLGWLFPTLNDTLCYISGWCMRQSFGQKHFIQLCYGPPLMSHINHLKFLSLLSWSLENKRHYD